MLGTVKRIAKILITPKITPKIAPKIICRKRYWNSVKNREVKKKSLYIGYKDAKSFSKRYLLHVVDVGKIQMTIPEHPTSKNQKYITVDNYKEE